MRWRHGLLFYGGQFDNLNILQAQIPRPIPASRFRTAAAAIAAAPNAPTATLENPVSPSITPGVANVVSEPNNGNGITSRPSGPVSPDTLEPHPFQAVLGPTSSTRLLRWRQGNITRIPPSSYNTGPPNNAATSGLTVQTDRPFPHYGSMRILDYCTVRPCTTA